MIAGLLPRKSPEVVVRQAIENELLQQSRKELREAIEDALHEAGGTDIFDLYKLVKNGKITMGLKESGDGRVRSA